MEYHENPEENTKENTSEKQEAQEEFSFMQETIKNDNGGYKKIRNTVIKFAGLGLIFGLAACVGFYALKPWAEDHFAGNPRKITIPEEEEEQTQEGEESQQEAASPVLTVDDYEEMNQALVNVGNIVNKSMAEISVQSPQPEEQNRAVQDDESVAGVIYEDNGAELLIAGKMLKAPEGGSLQARLADGKYYAVSVKRQDANLDIAVYAVAKNTIPDTTWNQIQTAVLGSSRSTAKGEMVIALGSYDGMGFGIVSSKRNVASRADGDYGLLCTDIAGGSDGTGILANTKGEVVGLIDQDLLYDDGQSGPVAAYGISDLKDALEFLSNGQSVPYIGVYGTTVTDELTAGQGIPSGVYVYEVSADSPAMSAGIQSGDVITEIDGNKVTSLSGFNSALMQQKSGDEIRIKGQRQGTGGYVDITFRVTVGSRE